MLLSKKKLRQTPNKKIEATGIKLCGFSKAGCPYASFSSLAQLRSDIQRDDRMYEWVVDDEQRIRLPHVAGISGKKVFTRYTLMYRTNPDHQIVEFLPSIGITRYIYQHHGTVSEVDVRLIDFRKK